jgi:hypothetical protein
MKSELVSAQPTHNGRAHLSLADPAGEAIASALGLRFDGLQEWAAGASWAFTDANAHSRTYQITFYTLPGAGLLEVAQRLQEKRGAEVER